MTHQKDQEHKAHINPFVVGAVAAAGAAAASYYFAKDEQKEKINHTLSKIKDTVQDTYHALRSEPAAKKAMK